VPGPVYFIHPGLVTLTTFVRSGNDTVLVYVFGFLGALAKLQKATVCFVMSVRTSVRPSAWGNSAPTARTFMKFDICGFFENLSRKLNSLKSDKNKGHYTDTDIHLLSYLAHFFLVRKTLQTKVVEKIKTYILCSINFSKTVLFMR